MLRQLLALSATAEVYLIVTYALRNKTSSRFVQLGLQLCRWLFAGRQR